MIELMDTGGGCTAYRITSPNAPHRYVYVTDDSCSKAPKLPETDALVIGLYHEETHEDYENDVHYGLHEVKGRQGLLDLLKPVSTPDALAKGEAMPILDLIHVAACFLLSKPAPQPEKADEPG